MLKNILIVFVCFQLVIPIMAQKKYPTLNTKPTPPLCTKKAFVHKEHGVERKDDYYWLKERENPEVIKYLELENTYHAEVMSPTQALQKELYEEMRGRIQEEDTSAPVFEKGYWYYTRTLQGGEYYLFCRKKESLNNAEEILLDVEQMAKGFAYYHIGDYEVSNDNQWLVFTLDTVSRRQYSLYIKNLQTQEVVPLHISNVSGESVAWDNTGKNIFYITNNPKTLLSEKVYCYNMETKKSELLYTEKDPTNYLFLSKSKDDRYLFLSSESTMDNEWRFIDLSLTTEKMEWQVFANRKENILYYPDNGGDVFYMLTNDKATNFKLMQCQKTKRDWADWEEVIPEQKNVLLSHIEVMKNWLVVEKRTQAKIIYTVMNRQTKDQYTLPVEEEVYDMSMINNVDYDTDILRFHYTSLTTPPSELTMDLKTKKKTLLKQKAVLGGFDKNHYQSERIWVKARDGAEVPVSLVYKKGLVKNGKNPCLLYAYGSYGYSIDPAFSPSRISLLDRGFVFAIAHIRGGQELGREWYENGKLLKKTNTFFDFIDVAKNLIEKQYTSTPHLFAMGGSAGGLLMGAVVNYAPELWRGVVAAVPFVDVVTTMFDESIPLTTNEFDEWGNPKDKKYFDYMMSYSPYDNVQTKNYPNLLVTTGLHDSQVQYWEPAKWVAKMRELNPNAKNITLLKTQMTVGHSGSSGRFEYLKEIAMEYAFMLALESGD